MLIGHPVFWILAAAVVAPLLSEIPIRLQVPVVVLEVVLGIVIGPHALNLVQFDGFVETMFAFGMAATLFMGGMELDFADIKARPMLLAAGGWAVSVMLSLALAGLLHLASSFPDCAMVGSLRPYSGASSWLPARLEKSVQLSVYRCCCHGTTASGRRLHSCWYF
jgi:Kef-type K+ transport system membrane component KefB